MGVGSIIGGVASIGQGLLGSSAAKNAARAQGEAIQQGVTTTQNAVQQGQEYQAPYRSLGTGAATRLSDMMTPGYDYTASPGYQFRFNEGQRAVDSSGAARGLSMSGGTLKALTKYGQGVASDDFNNSFNQNLQLSSLGQNAATNSGQIGMQGAQTLADLYTQGGNAKAAGIAGSANAWSNTLGSIASLANTKGANKFLGSLF